MALDISMYDRQGSYGSVYVDAHLLSAEHTIIFLRVNREEGDDPKVRTSLLYLPSIRQRADLPHI